MSDVIELKYSKKPGTAGNYLRLTLLKRPGLKPGQELPEIKVILTGVTIDPALLNRYTDACGLKEKGIMPILFPHVLASPLYMAMLSHRAFPIPLMGSLHLRNHLVQYRPVMINELFDITVELQKKRVVKQGLEFDFTIELNKEGEILWKSISTWMKRGKFGTDFVESPRAELIEAIPDATTYKELYIPKNMGKKFARITGDYNPIHISRLAAPLFGLKRDIAHAMWACAQAMGVLPDVPETSPIRVDLAFKGPLFLDNPSRVTMKEVPAGYRFDYYCGDNPRPSVQGKVTSVSLKEKP